MKYIVSLVLALFLSGCGGAGSEYLLSVPAPVVGSSGMRFAQIGVDQITVPDYLSGNKIPKMETPGVIDYCDNAVWVSRPEKALTEHMISYLKKYFQTPNVHRFPWDVDKSNGVRLKVEISRFVYTADAVELEADYYIEPLSGSRRVSKRFAAKVPVRKGETVLIVEAMNKAFDKLAAQAARSIAGF